MYRRLSDKFRRDKTIENNRSDKKKPMFPAYVPSHMEASKGADNKHREDLYETNQLYVTNLPKNTNMQEIHRMFPECVGIALGVNDANESHAAYVEFRNPKDAEDACTKSRGSSLRGNTLIVSPKLKFK